MLNTEEIINHLKLAIEVSDSTFFNESTVLNELEEWDSLSSMSIIAMMHQNFGLIIGAEEMRSFITVKDILNYISQSGK